MKSTTELLRLAESDPLVLSVSALTDFLWPDFVRETKPQVNYFTDRFEIRQLSRFGKELFEFFYSGGEVTPLVSLNDMENYFRQKQNGERPSMPKGYNLKMRYGTIFSSMSRAAMFMHQFKKIVLEDILNQAIQLSVS